MRIQKAPWGSSLPGTMAKRGASERCRSMASCTECDGDRRRQLLQRVGPGASRCTNCYLRPGPNLEPPEPDLWRLRLHKAVTKGGLVEKIPGFTASRSAPLPNNLGNRAASTAEWAPKSPRPALRRRTAPGSYARGKPEGEVLKSAAGSCDELREPVEDSTDDSPISSMAMPRRSNSAGEKRRGASKDSPEATPGGEVLRSPPVARPRTLKGAGGAVPRMGCCARPGGGGNSAPAGRDQTPGGGARTVQTPGGGGNRAFGSSPACFKPGGGATLATRKPLRDAIPCAVGVGASAATEAVWIGVAMTGRLQVRKSP
mmetsp:Transcript_9577/g.27745  ORF Transcript_9577/g.27745 Transcript_9577/m.27745 type:complete len:315 (+) Transcript_9577:281-1225(+)